jgi:hypothetical protein
MFEICRVFVTSPNKPAVPQKNRVCWAHHDKCVAQDLSKISSSVIKWNYYIPTAAVPILCQYMVACPVSIKLSSS